MASNYLQLPDANAFERKMLSAYKDITALRGGTKLKKAEGTKSTGSIRTPKGVTKTQLNSLHRKGLSLLDQIEFRRRVCAGLRGVSKDVKSIIKKLGPVAVGAGFFAGVALDPYLWTLIAIAIYNFGVEALCVDLGDKNPANVSKPKVKAKKKAKTK